MFDACGPGGGGHVPAVIADACGGGGAGSSTSAHLAYFHADRASKTYYTRLQNGVEATLDFQNDTATLYLDGNQKQYPLQTVLLQASNGNSQAATAMYNQMYQAITEPYSDSIIAPVDSNGSFASTNAFQSAQPETEGFERGAWSTPLPGQCGPLTHPCSFWQKNFGDLGPTNFWWSSPFGNPFGDPVTPPDPNSCAPNDDDCRRWERERKDACDEVPWAMTLSVTADAGMAGVCGLAALQSLLNPFNDLACIGTIGANAYAGRHVIVTRAKCEDPYPGQ